MLSVAMKTKTKKILTLLLLICSNLIHAQNARYLSWIADSLFESGSFKKSTIYYDSAIQTNTTDYSIFYNASCAYAKSGEIEKAIRLLRKSFELGMNEFDWMYYDLDLNTIRNHEAYIMLEAEYRDPNTVYYFDIIRDLMNQHDVSYNGKLISTGGYYNAKTNEFEEYFGNYEIQDVYNRLGLELTEPIFDFSDKTLAFWECDFRNEAESSLLRFLKLKRLEIVGDGEEGGELILSDIEVEDLIIIGTDFEDLTLDKVILNGLFQIHNTGEYLNISNSTFLIQSKLEYESNAFKHNDNLAFSELIWLGDPYRFIISNVIISESKDTEFSRSFPINVQAKSIEINQSKFIIPIEFKGGANTALDFHNNEFKSYVDFTEFHFPEFNFYIPFKQFKNAFVAITGAFQDFKIKGIYPEDLKDVRTYDQITNVLKLLHNNYRNRGEISSANQVYRDLKNLEIWHLQQMEAKNGSERLRLVLNQIMGFYTDHGTSPGKAILISFYIIMIFSVFYFFYPSEWDNESKSKLMHDFKVFIEKNDHGYVQPLLKLLKGSMVSLINAFTLSVNAFITLGFGKIPTSGMAKYICVFQGLLGWFLLSLFTVSLINQVLL